MTNSALMNTYGRNPIAFEKGDGVYLYDQDGKRYMDAVSSLAVCGLGHNHPVVTSTIQQQAAKLLHTSNLYEIPQQTELAKNICAVTEMDKAFFGNSGAEANEAAIKIARLFGHQRGIDTPTIIVTEGAFHGRTLATLSATGNRKVHAGFEPLVPGFLRVPFNDLAAIEQAAQNNSNIVAILLEPIQGEGGVNLPDDNYLPGIRALCDQHQWLMMLDEIQTGIGRTGKFLAYQHHDFYPDVVSIAKGLANGVPIGVCLAKGEAAELMQPGNHGTTFGGNPLSCATGNAVLKEIDDKQLCARAAELGDRLLARFNQQLSSTNSVKDIRGKGLMLGIELAHPCQDLVAKARDKGFLINVTHDSVIRLLPPLVMSNDECDQLADVVISLIKDQ